MNRRLGAFPRRALTICVILVLLDLIAIAPVDAGTPTCSATWDGGAGTSAWAQASNWIDDALPVSTDFVCIASTSTVVIDASVTVEGIRTTGSGPTGSLTVVDSGSLTLTQPGRSGLRFPIHVDGALSVEGSTGRLRILEGGSGSGTLFATGIDRLQIGGLSSDDCGIRTCVLEEFLLQNGGQLLGGVTIGIQGAIAPVGMLDPLSKYCPDGPIQTIEPRCPDPAVLRIPEGAVARASGTNSLYAGTLAGQGSLQVVGTLNWTGDPIRRAVQTGPGTTTIAAGGYLLVNGPFGTSTDNPFPYGCFDFCGGASLEDGRTIVNRGTTILRNAGFIAAEGDTGFTNEGRFRIENQRGYYRGLSGASGRSEFRNDGVVIKVGPCADAPSPPQPPAGATGPPPPPLPTMELCVIDANYSGSGTVRVLGDRLSIYDSVLKGGVAPQDVVSTGTTTLRSSIAGLQDYEHSVEGVITHKRYATAIRNITDRRRTLRVEETAAARLPFGYMSLGKTSTITNLAPSPTKAVVRLELDSSLSLPSNPRAIVVFQGGDVVRPCAGASSPVPCVVGAPSKSDEGDIAVRIRVGFAARQARATRTAGSNANVESFGIGACLLHEKLAIGTDSYQKITLAPGRCLDFAFSGPTHTVTELPALGNDHVFLIDSGDYSRTPAFVAAGSFVLVDHDDHLRKVARVGVKPSVHRRTVTWAWGQVLGCACRYKVQYRHGSRRWKTWFWHTDAPDSRFSKDGRYRFRVQLINTRTGARSKFSPIRVKRF